MAQQNKHEGLSSLLVRAGHLLKSAQASLIGRLYCLRFMTQMAFFRRWLLVLLAGWQTVVANGFSENQIKAAYLYNFAKFVEWPADVLPSDANLKLCVVGTDALDGALQDFEGRKAGEHVISVETHGFSDPSLTSCHMVFIGNSEAGHFVSLLKALANSPVLTLSDISDFAEKGGGIGLRFLDNKVVFEVNLESINTAGLRLPGQLLNIASYVYGR